jgi:hypothetical protein
MSCGSRRIKVSLLLCCAGLSCFLIPSLQLCFRNRKRRRLPPSSATLSCSCSSLELLFTLNRHVFIWTFIYVDVYCIRLLLLARERSRGTVHTHAPCIYNNQLWLLAPPILFDPFSLFFTFSTSTISLLAFLNQPDSRDGNKMKGGERNWTRNNQQTN